MSTKLPIATGSRVVGIRIGNEVYAPALPSDGHATAALARSLHAHYGAIAEMDRLYAGAAALEARRYVAYDPAAEREVRDEINKDVTHEREIAALRRRREKAKAEIEALEVEDKRDAIIEFKDDKTKSGRAGFEKRRAETEAATAEAKLKASLAREDEPEIMEPERKPEVKAPDLAQHFARLVDDLDEQIAEAESKGRPTEDMRAQQKLLNELMRKELLKGIRP